MSKPKAGRFSVPPIPRSTPPPAWFVAPCAWFAGCTRQATGTTPHPVLGNVPTCDECHAFATKGDGKP